MIRRVLHLLGSLGAGGEERQTLTLVKGLRGSRWEPIVCGMRGGALAEEFARHARTIILEKRRKVDLAALAHIRAIMDEVRPAVLHCHLSTANTWGRIAALMRPEKRPAVVVSEGGIETWKTVVHLAIDRALLGVTDAVVGNAEAIAHYLIDHDRIPARIVRVIPNGIDLARVQAKLHATEEERVSRRKELGLTSDHFVVGHVGRSCVVKGLDTLAAVIEQMVRLNPDFRLVRAGQPPLPDEIEPAEAFRRDVEARGVADHVIWHPYTPDISSVLMILDALVQTSLSEGLPNAVLEAMAMGVPVVATAAGGTSEIVRHRETGWLTEIGNARGLCEGLEHVRNDPEESRLWACRARTMVEHDFSLARMVENFCDLYDRVAGLHP